MRDKSVDLSCSAKLSKMNHQGMGAGVIHTKGDFRQESTEENYLSQM